MFHYYIGTCNCKAKLFQKMINDLWRISLSMDYGLHFSSEGSGQQWECLVDCQNKTLLLKSQKSGLASTKQGSFASTTEPGQRQAIIMKWLLSWHWILCSFHSEFCPSQAEPQSSPVRSQACMLAPWFCFISSHATAVPKELCPISNFPFIPKGKGNEFLICKDRNVDRGCFQGSDVLCFSS